MGRLKNKFGELCLFFVRDFHNERATDVFFRVLVVFTGIKIALLWSFTRQVLAHHHITLPNSWLGKIILGPAFVANANVDVFFGAAMVALLLIFLRRNYVSTVLFFWITCNLYIVYLPFANGADVVLFMLAFWCIPIVNHVSFKSETAKDVQKAAYNAGVLLCQLQVVFIYFVSGWDKLMSAAWRSGDAFSYVTKLETMFNPAFAGYFENTAFQFTLSWMTILFELSFCIFVWFGKTRLPTLVVGMFFHLFIWIVLSLPDFASVMMVSYILFLKDSDFKRAHFFRRLGS